MRIFRHFDEVPAAYRGAVVAIGNFDGVHRGHRALIAEAKVQAEARKCPLVVLTFEPHPQEYFRPSPECFRLTPLRTKSRMLADLGVDVLFALTFDAEMAQRSPQDFVLNVLVNGLGISGVVVGHDFEFGQKRAGNLATLSYMGEMEGFSVTAFDTVTASGEEKISSTLIRQMLKEARPEEAARLLGHPWSVEARVEHGDARLDEVRLVENKEQGGQDCGTQVAKQHERDPEEGGHCHSGQQRARQAPAKTIVPEDEYARRDHSLGE